CHANLQIVLETFSHTQQASKYSLSNGAETALTHQPPANAIFAALIPGIVGRNGSGNPNRCRVCEVRDRA
ncbi:hypothetical protein CN080_34400, partial [Sinorhizobium meliloti]